MTFVATAIRQMDSSLEELQRLRGLVLLGGSVRPGPLAMEIGRPLFDLPLDGACTILGAWHRHALNLGQSLGRPALPLRVMVNHAAPALATNGANGAPCIEHDPLEYRGTGGVLRDLAAEYAPDDLLLIASAAQVLLEPLAAATTDLAAADGDVTVLSHGDGTPGGLMLVRCGALRQLPAEGFVDMKEQALEMIARKHVVRVLERPSAVGLPVRTRVDYIRALRRYHAGRQDPLSVLPFAEAWESLFELAEEGAAVDSAARLHDAVVLRGARVEAGAVVVRSVIAPGGVVRRKEKVVDRLVSADRNGRNGG